MSTICTTCPYCGVGCGIKAEVDTDAGSGGAGSGRSVQIKGDVDHPANRGSLCSKGTYLGETVGLDGRLLHPMIGDSQVGWDHALDEVASRMRQTIEQHGPDSVALYVSGQLLTEDYYVANKLTKGFIGTGNIDTNSRLCMASAVAAHTRAFGEDVVPCSYDDLDAADLIILVGSNTAWCHPVIWQRIEKARERRGTKLVVIDPRRTETAERADLHIAVDPDGDVALFSALLGEMHKRGCTDSAYMAENVEVSEGFLSGLENVQSGISASQFQQLADLVAAHPRMITLFSQGANQSTSGTDKGNAIINLHLAMGRINRHGTGPFSITGQPNAMGGREVGGMASMLACHLGFSEAERSDVAEFWNSDNLCTGPGHKAVEMFRAVHDGRIKFLWVLATNPAVSMPDAGFVREALERCPTVVVSDVIADTDTGRFAHIRLPALAWGEKDGTVTNSERRVSRQRALFPAPGEARADWRIICDVAARLGHGDAFAFASGHEVFREFAAMTSLAVKHGKMLDLTDWAKASADEYDAMRPFQWGGTHPLKDRFPTPDGRAGIVEMQMPDAPVADNAYPLRLNTGRYRDQWHTMMRTGLSAKLSVHRREPLLEVHVGDAEASGLEDGGLARVITAYGSATFRVAISPLQRRGQIFVPMHWSDVMGSAGRTGRLTRSDTDPISGQPGFKDTPARIESVTPDWRGFLLTRGSVVLDVPFWTRAKVAGGWLAELAGDGTVDMESLLPDGLRSEVADFARGMRRIVVQDENGALIAALFITRTGQLPPRDWIAQQLGSEGSLLPELLAGRPAKPLPDRGPIVCVCHDIGEKQVLEAKEEGASTVAEVGTKNCAGTNCGSCRPIIARLLEQAYQPVAVAAE